MTTQSGCNLPEDLFYLIEKHVWARPAGDVVEVGLTDVAQAMAKKIISVALRDAGKPVKKGRSLATVESGKWVGPVPSPVSGEVVEVNTALASAPSTINSDPYGAGWVARVRCADWDADSADLATGARGVASYEAFLAEQGITCAETS